MWNTRNGTNRGFKRRYMSMGCGWMQSKRPRISPSPNEAKRTIDSAPVTTAGLYASKMHFDPRRWASMRLKDATGCGSPGIPAFSVVQRQRRNLHAMGTIYLAMLRRSPSRNYHLTSLSVGITDTSSLCPESHVSLGNHLHLYLARVMVDFPPHRSMLWIEHLELQ